MAIDTDIQAELQRKARDHLWLHFSSMGHYRDHEVPIIERGEGPYLFDAHGKRYLDMLSGLFTVQIGYSHGEELGQAALEQMHAQAPSLVILDLNNPRTDPLGTIAAMRADATLASIPTIGFVSHVDSQTIHAARDAGVHEVMARSAFAANLPEILARGKQPAEDDKN